MYKKALVLAVVSYFGFFSVAYGFCTWGIVPPGRIFEPRDATEVLISYNEGTQTVVLRPEFKGDVQDFGIVYPTPSKPKISEAPETIFEELNNTTNPQLPVPILMDDFVLGVTAKVEAETVTVVEEKQVGDFDVTVLTATDTGDLIQWLDENEYEFGDSDKEKMEYYVAQAGFHFIALKVDMSETPIFGDMEDSEILKTSPPFFFGELSPLEISFKTDRPQLPMRTLKSSMPMMTFDLYTLSDTPWYIPSVDTIYADIVDANFLAQTASLAKYNPQGQWLVRQEVRFEPKNSNQDVYLMSRDTLVPVDPQNQKRFSPGDLDLETGILPGTRGSIELVHGSYIFTRSLATGSRGEDVKQLQKILNEYGFTVSQVGPGSKGNETTYFGTKTKQALVLFQNFYRSEVLTPVGLTRGTGYFGPSTRAFLNK